MDDTIKNFLSILGNLGMDIKKLRREITISQYNINIEGMEKVKEKTYKLIKALELCDSVIKSLRAYCTLTNQCDENVMSICDRFTSEYSTIKGEMNEIVKDMEEMLKPIDFDGILKKISTIK